MDNNLKDRENLCKFLILLTLAQEALNIQMREKPNLANIVRNKKLTDHWVQKRTK